MYRGTIYNEFFANGYWKVLRPFSLDAIRRACLDLMGNEMRKDGMPSAAEIKGMARRFEGQTQLNSYLTCQQPGCTDLIPWPPKDDDGECRLFCRRHQPQHDHPATLEERTDTAATLTPKARAFLRSALPGLMAGIPVTAEEAEYHEAPKRDLPRKLVDYLRTVDATTAATILGNYQASTNGGGR